MMDNNKKKTYKLKAKATKALCVFAAKGRKL